MIFAIGLFLFIASLIMTVYARNIGWTDQRILAPLAGCLTGALLMLGSLAILAWRVLP